MTLIADERTWDTVPDSGAQDRSQFVTDLMELSRSGVDITVSPTCPICGSKTEITVDSGLMALFQANDSPHVQEIFPQLSADQRERLITGFCDTCWTRLFPDEEEGEREVYVDLDD